MTKRKYTNMQALESQILTMKEQGMTNREIAEALGLERSQIHNWIARRNWAQRSLAQGIVPNPCGRKKTSELERLRMENEVLRTFLKAVEKM